VSHEWFGVYKGRAAMARRSSPPLSFPPSSILPGGFGLLVFCTISSAFLVVFPSRAGHYRSRLWSGLNFSGFFSGSLSHSLRFGSRSNGLGKPDTPIRSSSSTVSFAPSLPSGPLPFSLRHQLVSRSLEKKLPWAKREAVLPHGQTPLQSLFLFLYSFFSDLP
jgi:hypothetical protein